MPQAAGHPEGSREVDFPPEGSTPEVAERSSYIVEANGDGAGVQVIHTDFDAALEPETVATPSPAPRYPYDDHNNNAAWHLLGAAALVGFAFFALPAELGTGGLVLAGAL